jgi:uncharacterized Zn finger protein
VAINLGGKMTDKPKPFLISEDSILEYCDPSSWSRGQNYFKSKMIYDAILVDNVLYAKCESSRSEDYNIQVMLSKDGIDDYLCTCPRGDFCKHIVALMLTYIYNFDVILVVDVKKQREKLNRLSKEELIDYLIKILRENPELFAAEIEIAEEKNESSAVELESLIEEYSKKADRCFYVSTDNPYHAAGEAAQNLKNLLIKNHKLADSNKIAAAALFTALFESIADHYSEVDDSNGILGGISWDCKKELNGILPGANLNTTERQKWQQRMFNHYINNDCGLADGIDNLLLETHEEEDIDFLKKLAKEAIKRFENSTRWNSDYMKGELSRFLAKLHQLSGEEDAILHLYQEQKMYYDYVLELINIRRIPEAIDYAKKHLKEGYDIHRFAGILMENKLINEAEDFLSHVVRKISGNVPYYEKIFGKLASIYEEKEDWKSASDLYITTFKKFPGLENFKNLERAAKHLSDWETIENDMIEYLKVGNKYSPLVEIFLHLKQVDWALEYIKKENVYYADSLYLKVAEAAEVKYPEDAVDIYKREIEGLISLGGRGNYAATIEYFQRIQQLTTGEEFEAYITKIKQENRRRRALFEEIESVTG